jgi:hypothetical protein
MPAVIQLHAFIVCDAAARDPRTGKWTLQGVFDVVWVERFPAVHAAMDVYLRLAQAPDAPGRAPRVSVGLRWSPPAGAARDTPSITLQPNERGIMEAVVRVTSLRLDTPGECRIDAVADGEVVGTTVLVVAQLAAPDEPHH